MSDLISKSALLDSLIHCQGLGRKSCELVAVTINNQPTVSDKEIRDKAIEEFAEKFIYKAVCSGCSGCSGCTNCYENGEQADCEDWKSYMGIAKKMKEVGE